MGAQALRQSLRINLRVLRRAIRDTLREAVSECRHGATLRRYAKGKRDLSLNIGCGRNVWPGWLNLDLFPVSKDVFYFNALNPLPFEDGTVKRIHCEHFLEHLDFECARAFLAECRRVLQPGGTMRVIVPDADKYIWARTTANDGFFASLANLGNPAEPFETPNMLINQMFRMGGDHRYAWDFETLELVARKVNFSAVAQSAFNHAPGDFAIDGQDAWREVESLYAELSA